MVRTLASAVAVMALVGCGLALLTALLALRLQAEGFSARAVGINTAAGGIATLVGAPFIPRVARRFGVARLLLLAICLSIAAVIGFTLTGSYLAWFGLRFMVGLSATAMFVLSEFWIASRSPPDRRSLIIGIYVTALAAGFGLGPLVLTITGTAGNLPFYAGGVLLLASVVPLAVSGRDAPCIETAVRVDLLGALREAPVAMFAAVVHGAIEIAGLGLLPIYALRAGLDGRTGALFASLFIVGSSALQLPIGALADRIDRTQLLVILSAGGLAGAVVLALLGPSASMLFAPLLLAWGGTVGALYPVGLGDISARFRGADLAGANAGYVMSYAIGMLAGPPLVGEGLDLLPPSGFFWTTAVFLAAYCLFAGQRSHHAAVLRARPQ